MNEPRNRLAIVCLLAAVVQLGLASRMAPNFFPELFVAHAGDALWTIAAYLTLAFIFPSWPPWRLGMSALAISFLVEFSQLLDWKLLNTIRGTAPGRLVLGQGFLWVDLLRYLLGAACATILDWVVMTRRKRRG